MDPETLVEFSTAALTRLADIVAILSMEYQKPQWGNIAAILLIIIGTGNLWDNSDRVRKLLRDTEKMCTVSIDMNQFWIILKSVDYRLTVGR
jgi:hypothetical protein